MILNRLLYLHTTDRYGWSSTHVRSAQRCMLLHMPLLAYACCFEHTYEHLYMCLSQAAAQQQKSQSETSADSDSSQTLASASASDRGATATSALSSAAAAASDRVPAAVKETPKKVLNQAAKKSEGLKRKLEAPKAKKVQRKKNWQAYARQVSRSVVQWGKAYPAQLGLIGIAMLMTLMVFALLNRNSTSNAQRGASLAS